MNTATTDWWDATRSVPEPHIPVLVYGFCRETQHYIYKVAAMRDGLPGSRTWSTGDKIMITHWTTLPQAPASRRFFEAAEKVQELPAHERIKLLAEFCPKCGVKGGLCPTCNDD